MKRFVVIGNPIAQSKSPIIHAAFARQTGLTISYEPLFCALDGFEGELARLLSAGFDGANVTAPFKRQALAAADVASAHAQHCGAANTLGFVDGHIHAANTDGLGLVRDIEANHARLLVGASVLLLGAGGAARGVIGAILDAGVVGLDIANRTEGTAVEVAQLFAGRAPVSGISLEQIANRRYDVVINATSAGLQDTVMGFDKLEFRRDMLAYEMVYGRETNFMQRARRAGASTADGLGMLVEQAAEAFRIWHGVRPETADVLATLRQRT